MSRYTNNGDNRIGGRNIAWLPSIEMMWVKGEEGTLGNTRVKYTAIPRVEGQAWYPE